MWALTAPFAFVANEPPNHVLQGKSDMFFCVALKLEPGPQVRCSRSSGISSGHAMHGASAMHLAPTCTCAFMQLLPAPHPTLPPPPLPGGLPPIPIPCLHTQELRMQEDELVGVRWMPLDEYLAIDFHASRPLLRQIQAACVAWADGKYR